MAEDNFEAMREAVDQGAEIDGKAADGMSPADWAATEDITKILEQRK